MESVARSNIDRCEDSNGGCVIEVLHACCGMAGCAAPAAGMVGVAIADEDVGQEGLVGCEDEHAFQREWRV